MNLQACHVGKLAWAYHWQASGAAGKEFQSLDSV